MKIIKEGTLPQNKTYQIECKSCGTIFEFQSFEAKTVSQSKWLVIKCPLCKIKNSIEK